MHSREVCVLKISSGTPPKNIHVICSTHGTTKHLPGYYKAACIISPGTMFTLKKKYLDIIGSVSLVWRSCGARKEVIFQNSLKGKVWIVHRRIKSRSAAARSIWLMKYRSQFDAALWNPVWRFPFMWAQTKASGEKGRVRHFLKL